MESNVYSAIQLVQSGCPAFFKFIAANETGETGGHQCGFYIPRVFADDVFDSPCVRGSNSRPIPIRVVWNNDVVTNSSLRYYGIGKDEFRLTRFGHKFEYLRSEYTGAIVVFVRTDVNLYSAFVFNSEEEIDEFLGALGLGPADANKMIHIEGKAAGTREKRAFARFIKSLNVEFPSSDVMSEAARAIEDAVYDHEEYIRTKPDEKLISWSQIEYRLFCAIEDDRYGKFIKKGFACVDDFIKKANVVLNRRKSRAGKSLEHHLSALFLGNGIAFDGQAVTEGNKRPDFIFPSARAYSDGSFPIENLVFLAAKTTCKDRWRQILNEADRFRNRTKYLCTLQQGMSVKQLDEMAAEKVVLVVPKEYKSKYPPPTKTQMRILTVADFIAKVKRIQSACCSC